MARQAALMSRKWPLSIGIMLPLALVPGPAPAQRGGVNPTPPGASQAQTALTMAEGGNSPGFDMAPETRLEVVEAAVAAIPSKLPPGPFQPTWDSLKENYRVPRSTPSACWATTAVCRSGGTVQG